MISARLLRLSISQLTSADGNFLIQFKPTLTSLTKSACDSNLATALAEVGVTPFCGTFDQVNDALIEAKFLKAPQSGKRQFLYSCCAVLMLTR